MKKTKKLILLELNEINFDIINKYICAGHNLPGFSHIINNSLIETSSEKEYDHLEPWIQWPSVHTGKTFSEHKIFRLGDSVYSDIPQIFEQVEQAGYSVGAISPMNTRNALKNPAYFIPDPWTKTSSDGSFLSKGISKAISQAVNDNSQSKFTLQTMFNLTIAFFSLVSIKKYFSLITYALFSFKKPWRKALFLDKFLYEVHKKLFFKKSPEFSTLFLNAGAHIQHHYFFNSPFIEKKELKNPDWYIQQTADPFLEMIIEYDKIINDLLSYKNCSIIISTGLSQIPFDKTQFYFRLKNHEDFLKLLDVSFLEVHPRMTRDFLIEFNSEESAIFAQEKLNLILVDNKYKLFGYIENRGKQLFVVLDYPYEIYSDTAFFADNKKINLSEHVVFVAIKNGMHCQKGYTFFSEDIRNIMIDPGSHVSNINISIKKYFEIA